LQWFFQNINSFTIFKSGSRYGAALSNIHIHSERLPKACLQLALKLHNRCFLNSTNVSKYLEPCGTSCGASCDLLEPPTQIPTQIPFTYAHSDPQAGPNSGPHAGPHAGLLGWNLVWERICDLVWELVCDLVWDLVYDLVWDLICDLVWLGPPLGPHGTFCDLLGPPGTSYIDSQADPYANSYTYLFADYT
jgi:hypothetical protein